MRKAQLLKVARQLHISLAWTALVALVLFVLSAITHPLMVWTGPKSSSFFPPSIELDAVSSQQITNRLNTLSLSQIQVAKFVATQDGPLLQITQHKQGERDYYPLSASMSKMPNYDSKQAVWLAHYYAGNDAAVKSVTLIDAFSKDYPWVNRLLPVYKVVLDTPDNLTLYVHTETNALASISNDWKDGLKIVFQWLHTWSFLDSAPILRVIIVSILLLSLLTVSLGGGLMLTLIKRKKTTKQVESRKLNKNLNRNLHRKLAWIALVPFLGLVISGLYHLLQYEYGELPSGMRLNPAFALPNNLAVQPEQFQVIEGKALNSLSLIPHNNRLLLRASVANTATNSSNRNARFNGKASESQAIFIELNQAGHYPNERYQNEQYQTKLGNSAQNQSGQYKPQPSLLNDAVIAEQKAQQYLGLTSAQNLESKIVTRFGPNYDFRNKRLPVWQITANTPEQDQLFIDPKTGILVEHTKQAQQLERLSFSMLHKWNFLTPFTGRQVRDMLVVVFLLSLLGLGYFGITLKKKSRKKAKQTVFENVKENVQETVNERVDETVNKQQVGS